MPKNQSHEIHKNMHKVRQHWQYLLFFVLEKNQIKVNKSKYKIKTKVSSPQLFVHYLLYARLGSRREYLSAGVRGSAVQLCTFRGGNRVRKVHNGGQFRKTCVTKEHELLYHEEYSLRNRKTIHASCVHLNSQSTGGDQRNLF